MDTSSLPIIWFVAGFAGLLALLDSRTRGLLAAATFSIVASVGATLLFGDFAGLIAFLAVAFFGVLIVLAPKRPRADHDRRSMSAH